MKRLFVILILLFMLSGCSFFMPKQNGNKPTDNPSDTEKYMIGEYDVTLTKEGKFENMKFKYPRYGYISNVITMTTVGYAKPGTQEILFSVNITRFENKTPEQSMPDNGFEIVKKGEKTYNGIVWNEYLIEGTNHGYSTYYDNDTYALVFSTTIDLENFEEEFLKTVSFD